MKKIAIIWKKYSFTIFLTFIILGMIDLRFALGAVICMIAPIIVALTGRGRFWCGNICPRGNFYDRVISRYSNNKKVNKFLKSIYFRLGVIIFMFTMAGTGIKNSWGNTIAMGMVFYRLIVVTTIVGIILAFVYNHRVWCNFCPMGSIAAFINHLQSKKLNKNKLMVSNSCVNCKICEKNCPMGIKPYEYKGSNINNSDCIQCERCVYTCPKKSIIQL
ncbi:4Fe-4S binding protein [Haloimpatiens sp. FM7330]|uniref:4Fe-4S binding protein n=1 Tax=Haloimpatiens sp. FM7330 TaxID=3298610 RepID=UPI0036317386